MNLKRGLSTKEAEKLLNKYGRNEVVPTTLGYGILSFLKFFKDPMGLMMLGLAVIYFLLGEKQDAYFMLIAFIPVSAIDVYLELKAEKALSALKATFQVNAKVFRDGVLKTIPIQLIVPGDLLALEEGQTIPADGIIQDASNLTFSESALTGESIPIEKKLYDLVYAGTSLLSGSGNYEVTVTGRNTKFGKIVNLLESTDVGISPLQLKVNNFVKQIIKVAFVMVLLLFCLQIFRGKSVLQSLLISLTFGMASVPEEFPLVFTLYLSLGAWRLAKSGVLVKSLPSVETLGAVNVICTDKTGTLTEGKFQLNNLISFNSFSENESWLFAILACEPVIVDSMDKAISDKLPMEIDKSSWNLIHDYTFEVEGKHMCHAWKHADGKTLVAMKGAVEGVLFHCRESAEFKKEIFNKTENLSSQGFRLLGLAGKYDSITGEREIDEKNLTFIGLLAFSDPVRNTAKEAIAVCQREGIEVKMITGDHPFTAHAIADQLGLTHQHEALYTGADLNNFSSIEKVNAFKEGAIFSRVTPEQKYELVKALKDEGLIIAMTGDGINDAPAMKIADIGISMGENATDTARATAKMVLTNSDFYGIVHAIMEGRRIFSNLRRSFAYLISFHVPIVLLSLIPPMLNMGDIITPMQIIMLELIVHPVSAFAFENLNHESGKINTSIIDSYLAVTSILAGVLVSILGLLSFRLLTEFTLEEKRTLIFSIVLFGNIGFILLESLPKFSKRLLVIIFILVFFNIAITTIPYLAYYLHLTVLPIKWILISMLLGLSAFLPSKILRRLNKGIK